jgi:hypothetical protein
MRKSTHCDWEKNEQKRVSVDDGRWAGLNSPNMRAEIHCHETMSIVNSHLNLPFFSSILALADHDGKENARIGNRKSQPFCLLGKLGTMSWCSTAIDLFYVAMPKRVEQTQSMFSITGDAFEQREACCNMNSPGLGDAGWGPNERTGEADYRRQQAGEDMTIVSPTEAIL